MAVAAPARRSTAAPAPAPSRTTPPKRKAPLRKPRAGAAAPAKAPARRAPAKAPPRRAPARKAAPKRRTASTQPRLVVAAGRTAVAVRQLPDSGLVVRMTRGRAWIAVLGLMLVGIVALNVATLSFAATAGQIDEQITALEKENSMLAAREAEHYSTARIRAQAATLGLAMPTTEDPRAIELAPTDVATAAARLAAAGG
ncbi:MAG TPA: hypothetical protein VFR75_04855 [Solirubrobacterales bacterium]|nr:hypothetical protein [Solirubrobacterales bacterium]